ncbi:MAG: hypothetical protein AAFN09_01985 [Pseudomonadota bacterium]
MSDAPIITAPERPELTLPEAEAEWVRALYAEAGTILEYGSGGSTVIAAERPGKTVFSVESDAGWLAMMQAYFDANPPAGTVHLHHGDIGPTKKWGRPVDDSAWRNYHRYPLGVWDREDFTPPDLVLIDGRFRAACLLATLLRTEQPVTVLFDDYVGRGGYHSVEDFARPVETRGRMARFDLVPTELPRAKLTRIFDLFTRVM